ARIATRLVVSSACRHTELGSSSRRIPSPPVLNAPRSMPPVATAEKSKCRLPLVFPLPNAARSAVAAHAQLRHRVLVIDSEANSEWKSTRNIIRFSDRDGTDQAFPRKSRAITPVWLFQQTGFQSRANRFFWLRSPWLQRCARREANQQHQAVQALPLDPDSR